MNAALLVLQLALGAVAIEDVRVEVGDGRVLERTTVLVDQGRIAAVGVNVDVPRDAARIDGSGKVLTPGFLDASSSLGLEEISLEAATVDTSIAKDPFTPAFQPAEGFNPLSMWIPVVREEGVTRVIVRPQGGVLFGAGALVPLTGALHSLSDAREPVALFGAADASAARAVGGARGAVWMRLREVLADARLFARRGVAIDENRVRPLPLTSAQYAALQPILRGELPLVLRANRASDILAALRFAETERLRLVIEGGVEAWRVAGELASANVPVLLSPADQLPYDFERVGARDDLPRVLDAAGVDVIIAGSARRLRQDAGIAVSYGLPRERAIRAICETPARVFGKGRELGTVVKGKRADLVLWSGDPLELSTVAEHVFIDGVEQRLDTRQRKLVERYLKRR